MSSGMVVIVDQHRSADEIFARRTDATDTRVLVANLGAKHVFGIARAFAPHAPGIAQFNRIFANVEIGWLRRGARDDDTVIARGFQRGAEIAATRAASQGIARCRTEINETYLSAARRKARTRDWPRHADNDVLWIVGIDIQRQLVEKHILREELAAPVFAQKDFFGEIEFDEFARAEINAQDLAHVAARKPRFALGGEEVLVFGCHRYLRQGNWFKSFKTFKPFKSFKRRDPLLHLRRERGREERGLDELSGLNGWNAHSVHRGPEHSVCRQIDIKPLPTLAPIAADHQIAGATGAGGMTTRDIAKAGEDGVRVRRMMHQSPDHRIEIVRKPLCDARPRLRAIVALEQ